ncbi:MAG: hypothetical protein R2710_12660 [Acidimicrobiales bacterium]
MARRGILCAQRLGDPFQWLWDSCFHALVWAELDDPPSPDRVRSALADQDRAVGFVPHHLLGPPRPPRLVLGRDRAHVVDHPTSGRCTWARPRPEVDHGVDIDDDTFASSGPGWSSDAGTSIYSAVADPAPGPRVPSLGDRP